MFSLYFLMLQEASKEPEHILSLNLKDILTFLGIVLTVSWTSVAFFLTRRDKARADQKNDATEDAKGNREQQEKILTRYRADLDLCSKERDECLESNESQIEERIAASIQVAVLSYEHELLYMKLPPDFDPEEIRKKVNLMRDRLTERAVNDRERRNLGLAKKKSPEV